MTAVDSVGVEEEVSKAAEGVNVLEGTNVVVDVGAKVVEVVSVRFPVLIANADEELEGDDDDTQVAIAQAVQVLGDRCRTVSTKVAAALRKVAGEDLAP